MDKTIDTMEKEAHFFTMMNERIKDMTWPIGIEIQDVLGRWYEGKGMIELDVHFILQPEFVPIQVQSIELHFSGNWFYGIDIAASDEIPVLVGQQLDRVEMIEPQIVRFKIPEPTDRDTVIMNPALVVEAIDLPCIADLSAIEITRQ